MTTPPIDATRTLTRIRNLLSLRQMSERGYGDLLDCFRQLDAHLSAGGAPPEQWQPVISDH